MILGINMTPLNTTWEQQHQHVCTLCWIVQAHVCLFFFCFKKKEKKKFASISSYRQQQPQGQQLLVIQKKKKKVFKKLKHNSNDRIKVQTVSGCTAFLSGYSLHQETGEIAVRRNTETSPPDASGVAGQELAQGCPLLVSFGTAGNKQFVDPLM